MFKIIFLAVLILAVVGIELEEYYNDRTEML